MPRVVVDVSLVGGGVIHTDYSGIVQADEEGLVEVDSRDTPTLMTAGAMHLTAAEQKTAREGMEKRRSERDALIKAEVEAAAKKAEGEVASGSTPASTAARTTTTGTTVASTTPTNAASSRA
jgi:hypothetical protein